MADRNIIDDYIGNFLGIFVMVGVVMGILGTVAVLTVTCICWKICTRKQKRLVGEQSPNETCTVELFKTD